MNIEQLRELKKDLLRIMDYYPPDGHSTDVYVLSERRSERARERYNQLAPVFALLEEMDLLHTELAKQFRSLDDRLNRLENLVGRNDEPN